MNKQIQDLIRSYFVQNQAPEFNRRNHHSFLKDIPGFEEHDSEMFKQSVRALGFRADVDDGNFIFTFFPEVYPDIPGRMERAKVGAL